MYCISVVLVNWLTLKKIEFYLYFTPHTKLKSRYIVALNVKGEIVKLLNVKGNKLVKYIMVFSKCDSLDTELASSGSCKKC